MEWIVLGSGTSVAHPERGSAGHLLVGDGEAALFDAGSGTKDRLARAGVGFHQITHVLCTHGHLDHWADLLSLLFDRANTSASKRRPGQVIAGPPGFVSMVKQAARAITPSLLDDNADLRWRELEPGQALQSEWFTARAHRVSHGTQYAIGYRIEPIRAEGWSVAYTGDTGPTDALEAMAEQVKVLVCECSLPSSLSLASHMTPAAVRALAERVHPELLVLTHLYPEVIESGEIERVFAGHGGKMVVGYDGLRVSLADGSSAQMKLSFPA